MNNRFESIMEKVVSDDVGKHDFTVPLNRMRMVGGTLVPEDLGVIPNELQNRIGRDVHPEMHLTDWAMNQLCLKIGVPKKYLERCPKELMDRNVNEWLPEVKDNVKFRCKNTLIRGMVSEKYVPLDNITIASISQDLMGHKNINIVKFDLTDQSFNLRLVFPDLSKEIKKSKVGDIVQVGVHVTNSEVGASAVHIYALVFRLKYTNGLISTGGDDEILNQRHIGIRMNELKSRFGEAIGKAAKVGADMVEQFIASQDVPVNDPMKVIEDLAKDRFTEKFTDQVKTAFQSEPDNSRFGIVNALTLASQTMNNMDARLEVEQFATKYMMSAR